jgi:hypothetical protein
MGLSDWQWNVLRSYVYLLLQDANDSLVDPAGNVLHLPLPATAPSSIDDIIKLIRPWSFPISLSEELELTAEALKDASGSLAAAHDLAASVMVNSPSQSDIFRVSQDLSNISDYVKNDQQVAALSDFFAGAAKAARSANTK